MTILCLLLSLALPQDLAGAYKLQFENTWVRVTRVHYAPHVKLPSHAHTDFAAAYVYLNDAPPVVFTHHGVAYGAVTRPATKAGGVRFYRAVQEQHEVENTGDTPSDFLRVEFNAVPLEDRSLSGRFFHVDAPKSDNLTTVQVDNDQIKMTRVLVAPGKSVTVKTSGQPSLLVALSSGQTTWVEAGSARELANRGAQPEEWLRFDLKTSPR